MHCLDTMHSITDERTDNIIVPIAHRVQYDRLKIWQEKDHLQSPVRKSGAIW